MREIARGFYGIGIYSPKNFCNWGTLYRSAMNFGANFTFTIGHRYKNTKADTCNSWRHIPCFQHESWGCFLTSIPRESILIGVEMTPNAHSLVSFTHPERAVYVLGSEDYGLPSHLLKDCNIILKIPSLTTESLNVATCGSLIMWDRQVKRGILK